MQRIKVIEKIVRGLLWVCWWQGLCISADKTFCSGTVFARPFRYASTMKTWVQPSLYRVNLPSFSRDSISFISPPNTPIHTAIRPAQPTNKMLQPMVATVGNKYVALFGFLKDLPAFLSYLGRAGEIKGARQTIPLRGGEGGHAKTRS